MHCWRRGRYEPEEIFSVTVDPSDDFRVDVMIAQVRKYSELSEYKGPYLGKWIFPESEGNISALNCEKDSDTGAYAGPTPNNDTTQGIPVHMKWQAPTEDEGDLVLVVAIINLDKMNATLENGHIVFMNSTKISPKPKAANEQSTYEPMQDEITKIMPTVTPMAVQSGSTQNATEKSAAARTAVAHALATASAAILSLLLYV